MTKKTTFRQLDSSSPGSADSALDEWYITVRDIPIDNLTDGDLSRACRQQLYPEHVVPLAIARLEVDPLAGEVFDGELLASMKSVPKAYWHADQQSSVRLLQVIESAKQSWDDDVRRDADDIASMVQECSQSD